MKTLDTLLQNAASLPSLPAIALRIIKEVKKDSLALSELVDIISFDPALTVKILKVANSSFYALPYKVKSLDRAVNILGIEALKNIALSFVIVKGLKKKSVDKFDQELFWKRAITAAVSSEMLASELKIKNEEMFVLPLLMDIGLLVMYLSMPDEYLKVLDLKRASNVTTVEVERSIFGFDHQEVGSQILEKWDLPDNIYMPIAYHHRSEGCPDELQDLVNVLKASDMISSFYHGNKSIGKLMELKEFLGSKSNMDLEDLELFIDLVAERTVEILSSFEIDPGDMKPYSQILQEANEELGKLNLSYEQLLVEHRQAKQEAEEYAVELWTIKEKLREASIKDAVTELYNHRYFQEMLDKELERAERYSHNLSIMMIDIDHFKKVNDTYGHPQGDKVLHTMGQIFSQEIRTSDIAARYGGEEFAIIMPETDINGAVILAERIRKAVEQHVIEAADHKIKITISIGLTTYDPGRDKKNKAEIINVADKALYNSKATGRNKLSIVA